ncbi:MAG: DUF362 domain-containing protein [Spirochaetales bacterium]|nr:DUF362 domain-containing protein [Spirochaetales bacterium]
MTNHSVSLVACEGYGRDEVQAAVERAVELCGGFDLAGRTVLVKPNMLGSASVERAVSTHPEMLRATIRMALSRGASRVLVGDSPAFQSTDMVGVYNGLKPVALEEGAEWVDFGEAITLDNPGGTLVHSFEVASVVTRIDAIISLSRLKTHSFMYFTGAAKNLFGMIPGLRKSQLHLRFPRKSEFGTMIVDLVTALASALAQSSASPPVYAIMDGIVAMEGAGPYNGDPRKLGVVLAGDNVFAVDWAASSLIGYDPMDVPYVRAAATTNACGFDPAHVQLAGLDPAQVHTAGFKRVQVLADDGDDTGSGTLLSRLSHTIVRNLTVPRPFVDAKTCVLCGSCVRICPAHAMSFLSGDRAKKRSIVIDYSLCIRCYCCHEVCPEGVISLKRRI